jgi:hypothetical protein
VCERGGGEIALPHSRERKRDSGVRSSAAARARSIVRAFAPFPALSPTGDRRAKDSRFTKGKRDHHQKQGKEAEGLDILLIINETKK